MPAERVPVSGVSRGSGAPPESHRRPAAGSGPRVGTENDPAFRAGHEASRRSPGGEEDVRQAGSQGERKADAVVPGTPPRCYSVIARASQQGEVKCLSFLSHERSQDGRE